MFSLRLDNQITMYCKSILGTFRSSFFFVNDLPQSLSDAASYLFENNTCIMYFSHVIKSRILKNPYFRRRVCRNFRKPFQVPKVMFKSSLNRSTAIII